ncbi:MAG: type II and III secretion system protein family protein [Methylocystis sp.]
MTLSRMLPALLVAVLLCLAGSGPAAAQSEVTPTDGTIRVELNEGTLVRLDHPAASVFIANPEVADVAIKSPRLIYVFGKAPGETTLYAVDENENVLISASLSVSHNLSRLEGTLRSLLPGSTVNVLSIDGGIVLDGYVDTATESAGAQLLASRFVAEGETVINRLRVTEPNQVNLRVRVAEVSRQVLRQLGFNWAAAVNGSDIAFGLVSKSLPGASALLGNPLQPTDKFFADISAGDFDLNALIDALAEENLVSLLAEPNLTALSGETASFLAGGEFPVPISQESSSTAATITVEFKNFGVSLAFTPTVLSSSRISMRVRPEVSALSDQGAVQLGNFVIPALTVRRAETTVELASGQSFAIAGLIQNNGRLTATKIPGLGDIPILGELFRSDSFNRQETELVIIVTPYVVKPVPANMIASPTDPTFLPEGGSRLSMAPAAVSGPSANAGGLVGPVGFVIE